MGNANSNELSNRQVANAAAGGKKSVVTSTTFLLRSILLEESELHVGVSCATCDKVSFFGYRYKCIFCKDYNQCDDCFQAHRKAEFHQPGHAMMVIASKVDATLLSQLVELIELAGEDKETFDFMVKDLVHKGKSCAACGTRTIKGIRVKCDECHAYDLCWQCYMAKEETRSHEYTHVMTVDFRPMQQDFNAAAVTDRILIDSGCFGKVYKVSYQGKTYAMKTISSADVHMMASYMNEVLAYGEIRSNYVIKFFGCVMEPTELFILMEFMPKGSLRKVIGEHRQVSIRRKLEWLTDTAKGLQSIHRKGFVHKDIKPDNVLLDENDHLKIGDLGIANYDNGKGYFRDKVAPIKYMAPEIKSGRFSNKIDMFSFGLLMNELLTYTTHLDDQPHIPVRFEAETKIKWSLVNSCVSADPDKRPSAAEVANELNSLEKGFWNSRYSSNYTEFSPQKKDEIFLQYYKSL